MGEDEDGTGEEDGAGEKLGFTYFGDTGEEAEGDAIGEEREGEEREGEEREGEEGEEASEDGEDQADDNEEEEDELRLSSVMGVNVIPLISSRKVEADIR